MLAKLIGTSIGEGLIICDCLASTAAVPGDVCEFGVAQGATSALIANEIGGQSRLLWLYDSFEGLPAPTAEDVLIDDIFGLGSIEKYAGTMKCGEIEVISRLNDISVDPAQFRIVKGFFTPSADGPKTVSFAYIDFDFYKPIMDALRFISARMPVGGKVIVDDYGFFSAGAKTAVDEFLQEEGAAWQLSLPPDFCGKFCILEKTATHPSSAPQSHPNNEIGR